jgi:hypothetical protein
MTGASEAATAKMSVSSGGVVGIGATLPGDLGVGLHVKTSDSGASVSGDADELVLENGTSSASGGLTILSATNGEGRINFGDSGDDNIGQITYGHTNNDLYIKTNTNIGLKIDGDGIVTKPLQPAFFVRKTDSGQVVGASSDTTITYNSEIFDQNADFASNTFTAPVAGRYFFSGQVKVADMATGDELRQISIKTSNNSFKHKLDNIADLITANMPIFTHSVNVFCDMDANDTAVVSVYAGQERTIDNEADVTWFCGYLVC